jgi:uncharacterized protein YehS (DUF1456 family)
MINNNDILRRVRYTFDCNDAEMIALFGMGGLTVTRAQVSDWLKKDDDEASVELDDIQLIAFLNGFVIDKRGKREGETPPIETKLNNNIVLRKLKIALSLKDEDMMSILALVNMEISKHELSAFFRNPTQKQYRECKDQLLRKFLHGMQLKYRGTAEVDN